MVKVPADVVTARTDDDDEPRSSFTVVEIYAGQPAWVVLPHGEKWRRRRVLCWARAIDSKNSRELPMVGGLGSEPSLVDDDDARVLHDDDFVACRCGTSADLDRLGFCRWCAGVRPAATLEKIDLALSAVCDKLGQLVDVTYELVDVSRVQASRLDQLVDAEYRTHEPQIVAVLPLKGNDAAYACAVFSDGATAPVVLVDGWFKILKARE